MVMTLLLVLAYHDLSIWKIERTGIYQPLSHSEVLVSPGGEVYILHFNEATITRYDNKGKKVGTIGGKGAGPGEFTYPTQIFFQDDHLYVKDILTGSISLFKSEGPFIERIKLPVANPYVVKVQNGWLYGNWLNQSDSSEPAVYWADDHFKESKLVCRLKSRGQRGGVVMDGRKVTYSPLYNTPIVCANQDGTRVYISEPEGFHIRVIDALKKEVVHEIVRDEPPVLLDKDWLDEKIDKMKKKRMRMGLSDPFETLAPKYFPIIHSIILDPDEKLVVRKWAGNPGKIRNLITIDNQGKVTKSDHGWDELLRIAAVRDGYAYVTIFDPGRDEAGLAKVELSHVKDFIGHNPIIFEPGSTRTVVH